MLKHPASVSKEAGIAIESRQSGVTHLWGRVRACDDMKIEKGGLMTRAGLYAFGIGVLGWMGMMLAAAPGAIAYKGGIIGKKPVENKVVKSQIVKATPAQCQALAKMRGVKIKDLKGKILLKEVEAGKLNFGVGDGGVYTYCNGGLMSN